MEELLPSAPFLLPSFRCYLSSSLLYAYSTFSGEYLDMVDNSINLSKHASGWFFRHSTVQAGHLILE
jgi:hypothetical protein